jgi:hypothetical protein
MDVLIVWLFNTTISEMSFYCLKKAFVCEFQHTSLWKTFFSQCSSPLVGTRFCRHVSNSPRDKYKMLHNPSLLEKVVFLASKT